MQRDLLLNSSALASLLESKVQNSIQLAELIIDLHNADDVELDEWIIQKGIASSDDLDRIRRSEVRTLVKTESDPSESRSRQLDDDLSTRNLRSQGQEHLHDARTGVGLWGKYVAKPAPASSGYSGEPGSANRYDWIEQFARGGLGAVWRAHDKNLNRTVAVKELLPDSVCSPGIVSRFIDEAVITGQLEHPGIVPIYEFGFKNDGCPYYSMKMLDGDTLATEISNFAKLPARSPERVVRFNSLLTNFVAICNAMAFAHERGVIHRDLKPGNIILGKFGEASIVDWGIAKYFNRAHDEPKEATICLKTGAHRHSRRSTAGANRTRRGDIIGTPSFLSPEQARGSVDLDPRSDIYSLGVILYEIITGQAAFSGEDTTRIIEDVRNGQFDTPRTVNRRVPKALEAICMKAMAHDRENRYESALELGQDVRQFLAGEPVTAYKESLIERGLRYCKKRQSFAVASFASLIAISVVSFVSYLTVSTAHKEEQIARKSAEQARDRAIEAHRREVAAKELAFQNLKQARKAADEWLLESSGDIEFYPGLEKTRHEWLTNAVRHYTECSQEISSDDPVLRAEAAKAIIRLGDAQRLLGNIENAKESYDKAHTLFGDLVADANESPTEMRRDHQLQLANSMIGLGLCLPHTERDDEALNHLTSAQEILQALVRQRPDDDTIVFALARCRVAQARLYHSQDRFDVAMQALRESIRTLTVMRSDNPKRSHEALLASTILDLAHIQIKCRQFHEALQTLEHALETYSRLINKSQHRPDFINGRMTVQILLGNVYCELGDSSNSIACYEEAAKDFHQQMDVMYGGGLHSENLASAQVNLAQLLHRRGDTERARQSALFGHDELVSLVELHGRTADRLRSFAVTLRTIADLSDDVEAKKLYGESLMVYDHLVETHGGDADDVAERAVSRVQQVNCDQSVAPSDRLAVLRESHEELAALGQGDRICSGRTFVQLALADALLEQGEVAAAEATFTAAVEELRARRDLTSRLRLTEILAACPLEKVRDTSRAYHEARSLVADYPRSAECRLVLAYCELQNDVASQAADTLADAVNLQGGHETLASQLCRVLIATKNGELGSIPDVQVTAIETDNTIVREPFLTRCLWHELKSKQSTSDPLN
ncbi:MAG: serine/threonine protein kinase [Planctomycetales bacterium]|nr:serine/threonine protein kinase [Planctomycetales bacterium]